MKILGTTEQGYILEIGKDEAANFAGHSAHYADECKTWKVGSHIKISKVYEEAREAVGLLGALKSSIDALNKQTISMLRKIEIKENNQEKGK